MMKKTICLVLVLAFALLTGCKDTDETSVDISSLHVDVTLAETDTHVVFRSGEDYYLRFKFKDIPGTGYVDLEFLSVEDLRKHILEGDFAHYKMRSLQRFADDAGNIKIFNVNNMHQPKCPDTFKLKKVIWHGLTYYLCILVDEQVNLPVQYDFYEGSFEQVYSPIEESYANLGDSYTVTQLDYKNAVEYRSDVDKYICYDIRDGDRIIKVEEFYWLTDRFGYQASETMPCDITMWVSENGVTYAISFEHLYSYFTEHPGEEWLLSFGMEPFVPEE